MLRAYWSRNSEQVGGWVIAGEEHGHSTGGSTENVWTGLRDRGRAPL